jgi:BCCT family betaine/carnitine transporter
VILGMVGFSTLGCTLFYVIWGNSVMWMDLNQGIGFVELVREGRTATAIAGAVGSLAGQPLPLVAFLILGLIFVATTYDSASYAIAASATRNLTPGTHPGRAHRVFWAFALALLPVALVVIDTLNAAKSATLVVSLPLLGVFALMAASLLRSLRET